MNGPTDNMWTASNAVSAFRLLLTIPIVWLLLDNQNVAAVVVSLVAATTDWIDGRLARATGTVSEWGKIIDPIADKVLIGAVVVVMLYQQLMPSWFVFVVLLRDAVILAGGIIARRYSTTVPPSLLSGKLAVSAISLAAVCAILRWQTAMQVSIAISCILMALSLWDYGRRLNGIIRQAQTKTR